MKNSQSKPEATIRLQVYLSQSGICSRREAVQIIQEGRVRVNAMLVKEPGYRINPNDTVVCDGTLCKLKTTHAYFMMNKPRKVETTHEHITLVSVKYAKKKLRTLDIISKYHKDHIFYVGRLDYHSSGLLFYTSDGQLANRLSHPRYSIPKVYELLTQKELPDSILLRWQKGLHIDGVTYTLSDWRRDNLDRTKLTLTLLEGKNREIRKICEYAHIRVKKLHRISMATISLGNLKSGCVRRLYAKEVKLLYKITNLEK